MNQTGEKMKQIESVSRRDLLKGGSIFGAGLLLPGLLSAAASAAGIENPRPDGVRVTPEQALAYLKKGNAAYARGLRLNKSYAPAKAFTDGQWPFAAILGCADSRVQPDEIFGVTPANLFVVRNAGNVSDDDAMGSLEYAVEHLSSSLIVVMGHSNCGAVKATEGIIANGGKAGGHIDSIVNQIKPNIQSLPKGHTLSDAVLANAKAETERLISQSSIVEEAIKSKELAVVTATFDLATKKVTFVA
jgi:carbonic anhydrase